MVSARTPRPRYVTTRDYLMDRLQMLRLVVFAISFEPLRILCSYFLKISWWTNRWTHPPLFDLLNPAYSVLVEVQQYISALLNGESSRCVLPSVRLSSDMRGAIGSQVVRNGFAFPQNFLGSRQRVLGMGHPACRPEGSTFPQDFLGSSTAGSGMGHPT